MLTWQTPLGTGGRRQRHAVGEFVATDTGADFRYLIGSDGFTAAQAEGFDGYPGLNLDACASEDALAIFMRRLPSTDRSDYARFLETFGLSPQADWSDLSLLTYTGARLASDSYSITETFDGFDRPFRYIFDVAGFRRKTDNANGLQTGDPVILEHEPGNAHDPNAIQVLRQSRQCLGHINRLQCEQVLNWQNQGRVSAHVFRFNGRPVYPRLFLMADIVPGKIAKAA